MPVPTLADLTPEDLVRRRRLMVLGAVIILVALLAAWALDDDEVEVPPASFGAHPPSPTAIDDVPGELLVVYADAADACPGLTWPVLAGIGKTETDHDRATAVSSAGAVGPMQFLPATWEAYGMDADGDGTADIDDPVDAIHGAANLLCNEGAGTGDVRGAVWAYNHSDVYVGTVAERAAAYTTAAAPL